VTAELDQALSAARDAVLGARDPAATARRLLRFVARERAFNTSAAALTDAELAVARLNGIRIQEFACSPRRT
jgi:hypothetical protein